MVYTRERDYFAWISDLNNIKWSNLDIINPVRYLGIALIDDDYAYKMLLIDLYIRLKYLFLGSLVQFRGMLFFIAFPNPERLFGYEIDLNNTTIEFKKLSYKGMSNCKNDTIDEEECIPDQNDKFVRNIHHVIPIPHN